jgi:aminoglycoside phosphotransferase (APT) family kinase protein
LFRLPTASGPAWLKATPPFAADEATVIGAVAVVDRDLVPPVLAAAPHRLFLGELPGEDCWEPAPAVPEDVIARWVAVQAALGAAGPVPGLRDRRPAVQASELNALLDKLPELTDAERGAARDLAGRWAEPARCGLPETLVHGDFHPGNWRCGGSRPGVLDWADASWGDPVLDGRRAIDFLPAGRRAAAATAWVTAWEAAVPSSRPAEAAAVRHALSISDS